MNPSRYITLWRDTRTENYYIMSLRGAKRRGNLFKGVPFHEIASLHSQ